MPTLILALSIPGWGRGEWFEEKEIITSDRASYDNFGYAVAMNNEKIVAGAFLQDPESTSNAGAAYIFSRSVATPPPTTTPPSYTPPSYITPPRTDPPTNRQLTAPTNVRFDASNNTLSWGAVSGAERYEVTVYDDRGCQQQRHYEYAGIAETSWRFRYPSAYTPPLSTNVAASGGPQSTCLNIPNPQTTDPAIPTPPDQQPAPPTNQPTDTPPNNQQPTLPGDTIPIVPITQQPIKPDTQQTTGSKTPLDLAGAPTQKKKQTLKTH